MKFSVGIADSACHYRHRWHKFVGVKAFQAASFVALSALCAIAGSQGRAADRPNLTKPSETAWRGMDNCKRQAWKHYPDYTQESNANRDRALTQCLATGNLPPAAPNSPGASSEASRQ